MDKDQIRTPTKASKECDIYTKRQILKKTAAVFDPLGLFNPVLLKAKLLLRELWNQNVDWDEPITTECATEWKHILNDLKRIQDKKIGRFVGNNAADLLCFCDASSKAYGISIYLRCIENDEVISNLIFSKSRIAPLKETSLPRLELLAVLIGARSINFVKESLKIEIRQNILWTDSQCVLHWLRSKKILTPFVQRRVDEIRSNNDIEFRYVSTEQNPADIASRGCTAESLNQTDIWWYGPKWLLEDQDVWPTWNVKVLTKDVMDAVSSETKGPKALYEVSALSAEELDDANKKKNEETIEKNQKPPFNIQSEDHSSMSRLLRITAWTNRFINNTRSKEKQKGNLCSEELKKSRTQWIQYTQFDIARHINKETNCKDNQIRTLDLQTDKNGIVRCTGRFANSIDMPTETKKPIFLPRKKTLDISTDQKISRGDRYFCLVSGMSRRS